MNKLFLIIFSNIIFFSTHAQNGLFIEKKDHTSTSFSLENVQKLTFSLGNLIVHQQNSTTTLPFNQVQYISLKNYSLTTDISQEIDENKISLYPNPTLAALKITLNNIEGIVFINDCVGNTKFKQALHDGTNEIDTNTLLPGIYFAEIVTSSGSRTIKFIKQ